MTGFNNIDPEVDTESVAKIIIPNELDLCFNNIDPEVDTERIDLETTVDPFILVSTISIQKWILKDRHGISERALQCCFNNIDPEVDTESVKLKPLPVTLLPVSTISIQKWILKACWESIGADHIAQVSTISIQKWILKVTRTGTGGCSHSRFNNIDPEVDTERLFAGLVTARVRRFQQYRSRSGY